MFTRGLIVDLGSAAARRSTWKRPLGRRPFSVDPPAAASARQPLTQQSAAAAAASFRQRNAGGGVPPWALHGAELEEAAAVQAAEAALISAAGKAATFGIP